MSTSAVADGFVWFPYVSISYEKTRVIGVTRVIFIIAIGPSFWPLDLAFGSDEVPYEVLP